MHIQYVNLTYAFKWVILIFSSKFLEKHHISYLHGIKIHPRISEDEIRFVKIRNLGNGMEVPERKPKNRLMRAKTAKFWPVTDRLFQKNHIFP